MCQMRAVRCIVYIFIVMPTVATPQVSLDTLEGAKKFLKWLFETHSSCVSPPCCSAGGGVSSSWWLEDLVTGSRPPALLPFSSPRFRLPGSASCSMNPFQARSCETILDFFHSSPGDLQWTPGKETFDEVLATKNQPAPGPIVLPCSV